MWRAATAGLGAALAGAHDWCVSLGPSALRSLATCFGMVVGWGQCGLQFAASMLRVDSEAVVDEVGGGSMVLGARSVLLAVRLVFPTQSNDAWDQRAYQSMGCSCASPRQLWVVSARASMNA